MEPPYSGFNKVAIYIYIALSMVYIVDNSRLSMIISGFWEIHRGNVRGLCWRDVSPKKQQMKQEMGEMLLMNMLSLQLSSGFP